MSAKLFSIRGPQTEAKTTETKINKLVSER